MKKNKLALVISLFILLALPTVSLYYSFQGAKLRKIAMAELQPKGKLSDSLIGLLKGEYNYRVIGLPCEDKFILDSLVLQFIPENMQFVFIEDSSTVSTVESTIDPEKKASVIHINSSALTELTGWQNCQFQLVDKSNLILNTYDLQEPAQRRKIVEHIALLVTRK